MVFPITYLYIFVKLFLTIKNMLDNLESKDTKRENIMKTIVKIGSALLGLALVVMAFKPLFIIGEERDKVILTVIRQAIRTAHYENIEFDDAFSSKVLDEYIEKLDYSKRFLLKSDIAELEKFRYTIDDYIYRSDLQPCKVATELIKKRQDEAAGYYREAINGDFDFSIDEYIQTNPDSVDFAGSVEELRDNWRKNVKLAVLEKITDMLDTQEKAIKDKDTSYKQKTMDEIKADAIARVKETYDEWMKRISKIKDNDWTSLYFNSIIAACDPHSEYFPPAEKTNFDISMSGKFEGIGATLQNRNGQTKVVDIIPGSASWRQGELEVNDIILKVGQADNEPVDITNMDLDETVSMIRGKKGTVVKLTVKKIDGTIKVIPIERDIVVIEETYAKSSIITSQDGNTKIGYIYLPKFYADFNDKNGRFCSKDVKDELIKLSSEGVDGVVLDLRNNGGGSLGDVVDMSGLFINEGPIVQVKTKDGNIKTYEDKDKNVVYNGPMVVMVNNFSASASEILSAALQDYGRAIIMGSQSSFGKGTVQSIHDFDYLVSGNDALKPLGAIKITIQKFYRINGGTTQLKGVEPDIVLPDAYSYMKVGEKEAHNALQYDVIPKAQYELWKHNYKDKKVIASSKERIEKNPVFKQIDDNARRLKQRGDESLFSLNIDKYREYQKAIKEESEKYKKIGNEKTGVTASFLKSDKLAVAGDTLKTNRFTRWFADLEKDIYISEAINVIGDMK